MVRATQNSSQKLLIVAAIVLGIVIFARFLTPHDDAADAPRPVASTTLPARASATAAAEPAIGFGYKCAWIAAKGISSEALARALRLGEVTSESWVVGIQRSYDPHAGARGSVPDSTAAELQFGETPTVFVTPPVDGWTLAVGQRLAFLRSFAFKRIPADHSPDKLLPFLEALSRESGVTVQYFFTHRIPETHIWAWAESGRIVRAYGFSGEQGNILFNVGPLTPGERALGIELPGNERELLDKRFARPSEQTVIDVAGKWSVDPTRLHGRTDLGRGLTGALP